LKDIVYQTVIKFGTKEEWNNLLNMALKTNSEVEKLKMLRALAHSQDASLLQL
jgi:hypothetical protein